VFAQEYYASRPEDDDDERLVPDTAPVSVRAGILPLVARELAEQEYMEWALRGEPLPMRPVTIPERGQKTRLASMSPAMSVVLGQRINGLLLRLLKKSRVHNYSLRGEEGVPHGIEAGAKLFAYEDDFTLTSADLSAASDYIPHDVALATWNGICDALGDRIPPLYHTIGASLLGPMSWDGGGEKGMAFTSKRGILMGLPLTWPILSILNHFAGHVAMDRVRRRYPQMPTSRRVEPFVSCGDDFGAAWTRAHEGEYFKAIGNLGLVLNVHKTFSSQRTSNGSETDQLNGLVFVERLFLVRKTDAPVGVNKWVDPITNKFVSRGNGLPVTSDNERILPTITAVQRPTLSAIVAAKPTGATADEVPIYYKLGPILTQEARKCNRVQTEVLCDIAKIAHAQVVKRMVRTNVPLHWPIDLGGWGFPGKQEATALWRKAAASVLIGAVIFKISLKRILHFLKALLTSERGWQLNSAWLSASRKSTSKATPS